MNVKENTIREKGIFCWFRTMAAPEEGSSEIRKFSSVKFLNCPPFAPRQIPVLEGFADVAFSKQEVSETGRKFESHVRFLLCMKMKRPGEEVPPGPFKKHFF